MIFKRIFFVMFVFLLVVSAINIVSFPGVHVIEAKFELNDKLKVELCNPTYGRVALYDQYASSIEVKYRGYPTEKEKYGNKLTLGHNPNHIMPGITGSEVLFPRQCKKIDHEILVQLKYIVLGQNLSLAFVIDEDKVSSIKMSESFIEAFKVRLNLRNNFPRNTDPPRGIYIDSEWFVNDGNMFNEE